MACALADIDVLIVGGGLSGLVAAYKLLGKEPSLKILILEATSQIGGQLKESKRGELGAKWITEDQYHMYNLCSQLNIGLKRRHILREDLKRCWDLDKGMYSALARFEVNRLINEIDLKCSKYLPGTYKIERNSQTMEKYICSKLFFEQSRNFLRCFVRFGSGVEAKFITYTEFMSICYSFGGISRIIATFTGTSNSLFEFSSRELLLALEKRINSYYIVLQSKVQEIIHYTDCLIVRDNRNNQFCSSIVIMAIPWQNIQNIFMYPPMPPELRIPVFLNKSLITSFIIGYPEGYWRSCGYSGSLISHNPDMICYELKPSVYAGVVTHEDDFEHILKPIVLEKLTECFGTGMGMPSTWLQCSWEQPSLMNLPPTTMWGNIVWASTNTATCYRGSLSGAVQSGLRAAIQTLLVLRPQNVQWQDIDEIQRANTVRPRISYINLILGSVNIYNLIIYGTAAIALVLGIKFRSVFKY